MPQLPPAIEQLGTDLRLSMLPVLLGDIRPNGGEVESNGTAFVFQPGDAPFLVTAAHVYEEAVRREKENPNTKTGIGSGCRLLFSQRTIDVNNDLDIATLRLSSDEVIALDSSPIRASREGWPPPDPEPGEPAILSGFPAVERDQVSGDGIVAGIYTAFLKVNDVGHRHISFHVENSNMVDYLGGGLPPDGYDLGGASGGPVVLVERHGHDLSIRLCGVVKLEASMEVGDIVLAARADYISESGEINHPGL